jgi:hypothetical protein
MISSVRTLVVCLLLACSHPPPPKPVVPESPVVSFSDVADTWTTSDDLDWGYFLTIKGDDFSLTVDRGKLGQCVQHATLVKGSTAPKFELEVEVDECHRDRADGPLFVTFSGWTATSLTVDELDGDHHERHTFHRPNRETEYLVQ